MSPYLEFNLEPALEWSDHYGQFCPETHQSSISYFRKVSWRAFYFLFLLPGMILFSSKVTELGFHVLVPVKANHDEYHEKTLPQTFTIPLCFPVQQLRLLPKQTRDRVSPH